MKKFKTAIAALLVCVCFFVFAACTGEQGKSAYEVAVENGYTGTETEWLESLKGEKGDASDDGMNDVAARSLLSTVSINAVFGSGTSLGSGVIVELDKENGDAYIVTNYHVVYYQPTNAWGQSVGTGSVSDDIRLYLYGQEYTDYAISAEYIGGSLEQDIAVLKVTGSDVLKNSSATAATADISQLYAGESVVAVGNPSGAGLSVTKGIVSVDSEEIEITLADNSTTGTLRVIRVDAAINSGNSGGGLYDTEGNLVGIVNAKIESASIENMAYAIPASVACGIADNIIKQYESGVSAPVSVNKAEIGVQTEITFSKAVYDADAQATRIVQTVAVAGVTTNGSASGHLRVGDELISITFEGKEYALDRSYKLSDFLYYYSQGDTLTLKVSRGGKDVTVSFTISDVTQIN